MQSVAEAERVTPTADPPVRPDGRCYMCPKKRKPERSRKYGGEVAALDPFCSSQCARRFYGTELPNLRGSEDDSAFEKHGR